MDSLDESKSFFKHVFNFDDETKSEILNILQYSVIAIIPVVILNKTMQKYVPEADDNKSSLEVTAEVLIQNKHLYLESKYLEDLALGDVIFHQLKYTSFEDQPHHHTHVWAFEDNFQPDHWIQNTDVFNYRFRSHTPEKLIKLHEHIMNKYDTKN